MPPFLRLDIQMLSSLLSLPIVQYYFTHNVVHMYMCARHHKVSVLVGVSEMGGGGGGEDER